jgi:hypothetical protein
MRIDDAAELWQYGSREYAAPIFTDLLRRMVNDLAAKRSDAWEPDRIQISLNITVELYELDYETQVELGWSGEDYGVPGVKSTWEQDE